jgi:Holliday junction resolvasome RuvABC endonuclease subunit
MARRASDILVLGVDIGFVKTGLAVVRLGMTSAQDEALHVNTIKSDTHVPKTVKDKMYVVHLDVQCCYLLDAQFAQFLAEWKPNALVAEFPSGGAQGARANRCMGLATGLFACSFLRYGAPCALFTPQEVVQFLSLPGPNALDLTAPAGEKLNKGKLRALKKQRVQELVERELSTQLKSGPGFVWPTSKALKEDAADALATVIAACRADVPVIKRLRERVIPF